MQKSEGNFSGQIPCEFCERFFGDFYGPFSLGKKTGPKNPPQNPRQNSNQNLGVSQPKSTLQGSGLDKSSLRIGMGLYSASFAGGVCEGGLACRDFMKVFDVRVRLGHGHCQGVSF